MSLADYTEKEVKDILPEEDRESVYRSLLHISFPKKYITKEMQLKYSLMIIEGTRVCLYIFFNVN